MSLHKPKIQIMRLLNPVYLKIQSLERRGIFLRSETPHAEKHDMFVSKQVYLNFKIIIVDLKLIVKTNHNK